MSNFSRIEARARMRLRRANICADACMALDILAERRAGYIAEMHREARKIIEQRQRAWVALAGADLISAAEFLRLAKWHARYMPVAGRIARLIMIGV